MASMIPCRICGAPTRYRGTASNRTHYGRVNCGAEACRSESRRRKNEAISKRHRYDYATQKRIPARHAWKGVARVSPAERLLQSWLEGIGWTSQFKLVPGRSDHPRCFWLDFAEPAKRLCVEIDGSVHRLRKEKDARKDSILSAIGWKILRVPADLVQADLQAAKDLIADWIKATSA